MNGGEILEWVTPPLIVISQHVHNLILVSRGGLKLISYRIRMKAPDCA